MKAFYLTATIICTVLILVLAFENIAAQCAAMFFFFYPVKSNPTIVVLGISILGVVTGMFFHAFLGKMTEKGDEEDDDF